MALFWLIFPVAAYLMGSIPFGSIIGRKIAGIDIKERGSGNIGATNVAREIGIKWGLLTLLLDVTKGFIPAYLLMRYAPNEGILISTVCIFSLSGNQFSLFLRFRGGKGVATTAGIFLALSPWSLALALFVFLATILISNIVSTGSMAAAGSLPLILYLLEKPLYMIITSAIIALLICFAHRENLQRIFNGSEAKWRNRIS